MTPRSAANAGSAAFTICANETAPRFIEKMEEMCAPAAHPATGRILVRSETVTCGKGRESGAIHKKSA